MPHTLMKQLTEMKLTGMAAALPSQMEQPGTYEELSFRKDWRCWSRESLERDQRKQKRLLQKARLRLEAWSRTSTTSQRETRTFSDRSAKPERMGGQGAEPADNRLLRLRQTYVGCAPGTTPASRLQRTVLRLNRLLVELTHSRADGSYRKQLAQLSKRSCLSWMTGGLEPLLPAQRNDLLELMDDRYGKNATVMISQLPTDEWYGCVGDNTLR